MNDLQASADRFEIEALRGEFTDAGMMRDDDRFASLFTQQGSRPSRAERRRASMHGRGMHDHVIVVTLTWDCADAGLH